MKRKRSEKHLPQSGYPPKKVLDQDHHQNQELILAIKKRWVPELVSPEDVVDIMLTIVKDYLFAAKSLGGPNVVKADQYIVLDVFPDFSLSSLAPKIRTVTVTPPEIPKTPNKSLLQRIAKLPQGSDSQRREDLQNLADFKGIPKGLRNSYGISHEFQMKFLGIPKEFLRHPK